MRELYSWAWLLLSLCLAGCSRREVGTTLIYEIDRSDLNAPAKLDPHDVVHAVDRRINRAWSKYGQVELQPDGRIRVGVFGKDAADVAYVKTMLGSVGQLEFRIMANTHDHAQLVGKARASNAREVMTTGGDGVAKVAARWVGVADFEQESVRSFPQLVSRELADRDLEVLIIQDDLNLDGSYVTSAQAISDSNGNPSVVFALNATGAQMLGEITIANLPDPVRGIKRQLGLILDGHLITAPSINSVIYERVEITGSFTAQETERIAAILLAGPFPAPLKLVSEAAAMP